MQWLGLLDRRFDYEKLKFEKSVKLRFRAAFLTLLFCSYELKIYVTKFWPREDIKQLYLGFVMKYLKVLKLNYLKQRF